MNASRRHYLDNAATSWPKPECVYEAVALHMRDVGAAAGRGAYREAVRSADVVAQTRAAVARLLSAESPECIVLTSNGTAALNLAIQGILPATTDSSVRPLHVVTTAAEHNSVLRPLQAYADRGRIELQIVACDASGQVRADVVLGAMREDTQLVAIGHASNVSAAIQPLEEIGAALADHPAWLLCDAAQSFAYLPIDVQRMHIDLLATPGHKGALGPLGTGILYVSPAAQEKLQPSVWGGSGGESDRLRMPTAMPQRLEAGNLNVPAIAGLLAGLQWLEQQDPHQREQHLLSLSSRMDTGLAGIEGIRYWGAGSPLPLRSLVFDALAPSDAGAILDTEFGVQVRTGLHCAARIHDALGSAPAGTVRVSAGHLSTLEDVDAAVEAIRQITAEIHT